MRKRQLRRIIREEIRRITEQTAGEIENVVERFTQENVPVEAGSSSTMSPTWALENHNGMSKSEARRINQRLSNHIGTATAAALNATEDGLRKGLSDEFDMPYTAVPGLRNLVNREDYVSEGAGRGGGLYTGRVAGVDAAIATYNTGFVAYVNPADVSRLQQNIANMLENQME
jgi:hypothetical protein